jgi:hypothetical protein
MANTPPKPDGHDRFQAPPIIKVMTVSLPCRAQSGWHAGIARWARSRGSANSPSRPPTLPTARAASRAGYGGTGVPRLRSPSLNFPICPRRDHRHAAGDRSGFCCRNQAARRSHRSRQPVFPADLWQKLGAWACSASPPRRSTAAAASATSHTSSPWKKSPGLRRVSPSPTARTRISASIRFAAMAMPHRKTAICPD